MRLLTRLAFSHSIPVLVMLGALGVVLGSVASITSSLQEVLGGATGNMRRETDLHRAGWAVELAMRHGDDACAQGASSDEVASSIRKRLDALNAELAGHTAPVHATMLGALNWTVKWFQETGSLSARQVGDAFAEILLGGLATPPATKRREGRPLLPFTESRSLLERRRTGKQRNGR